MTDIIVNVATQMIVLDPPLLNAIVVDSAMSPSIVIEQTAPIEIVAEQIGQAIIIPPAEISEITVTPAGASFNVILAGPEGPAGPQGPMGIVDELFKYEHSQDLASTLWTIPHDLNGYPQVTAVETATGDIIEGDITYVSPNTLTISFSSAVSGKAYLS